MKTIFYTFLLLVLFIGTIDGQNPVRVFFERERDDKEERRYRKAVHEYQYDKEGRKIEEITKFWDKELEQYRLKYKGEWIYEGSNLQKLESFHWEEEANDWSRSRRCKYQFNDFGCLTYSESINVFNSDYVQIVNYINNYDCSNPWKNDPLPAWYDELLVRRTRVDTVELEEFFYDKNNLNTPFAIRERTYNRLGQLVRFYDTYSYTGPSLVLKEYKDDSFITYVYYENWKTGVLELDNSYGRSYQYQDDLLIQAINTTTYYNSNGEERSNTNVVSDYHYENDLLIEINRTSTRYENNEVDYVRITNTFYEYYCDGLLKRRYEDREGYIEDYTYEYSEAANCDLDEPINFAIYPNPYDEFLTIESDLLQLENTVVNIYHMDGRLFYQKNLTERFSKLTLDLPQIGEGFWVVNIVANGKNYSRKVMSAR